MSDKTALGISNELRQFIEALVEEVVLEGMPYENQQKYLQHFCEAEGINYDTLEENLTDLFDKVNEWKSFHTKAGSAMVKLLGEKCYLSQDCVNKLLTCDVITKRVIQQYSGPLFPAWHEKSRKYGYIDINGNMVIEPLFLSAGCFSEGLANIKDKNGKWGYIDMVGNYIIPPHFDGCSKFSDGLARVYSDSGSTFIDMNGEIALKHRSYCYDFCDGWARVSIGRGNHEKYGFIDKTGKYVIKPFECHILAWHFTEGLAWFAIKTENGSRYGFINKLGQVVIEPKYKNASDFAEGLSCVQSGWIDKTGKLIVKIDSAFYASGNFSEGLAMFRSLYWTGKEDRGFVDITGKIVLDLTRFDDIKTFSEGLAVVEKKKDEKRKYGFINRTGETLVEPMFDYAWDFSNGLAMIEIKNSFGYVNKKGEIVYMSNYSL